jgi:hypothetical protein
MIFIKKGLRNNNIGLKYLIILVIGLLITILIGLSFINNINQGIVGANNSYDSSHGIEIKSSEPAYVSNNTWGGYNYDFGRDLVIDTENNIYVTGTTESFGAGYEDVILVKYDINGTQIWNKTWGGFNDDKAHKMTIDKQDYIYIVGYTSSYGIGTDDVAILKFDKNGNKIWNYTWGGANSDRAFDVRFDGNNYLYITGYTVSFGPSSFNLFLLKYDLDGNKIWNRTWGGDGQEEGLGLGIGNDGYIYVNGYTKSFGNGLNDIVILKYNSNGDLQWNYTWGSQYSEYGQDLVLDSSNNIYTGGYVYYNTTAKANIILLKHAPNGTLLWKREWNSHYNDTDHGYGITRDSLNNLLICGRAENPNTSESNAIIVRYDSEGNFLDDTEFGLELTEHYWSVLTLGLDDIYAVGSIEVAAGNYDTLLVKFWVDQTIEAPLNIESDPSGWSSSNSFTISWDNPPDASGIHGAFYKLDTPPTFDNDGTYQAGINITSLTISVPSQGVHTVYVWLSDGVGNINSKKLASTFIFYDSSILAPINLTESRYNLTAFNISWTNPSDLTDIVGAFYKFNSPPTSNTDGVYQAGIDIDSIIVSPPTEGSHTVYIWLNDSVGNINYINRSSIPILYDISILAPIGLNSYPDNWTNVNSFDVSWTNPSEVSGIVGAYYKLDSPPVNNFDGIFISIITPEILDISVNGDGNHSLYVWLEDAEGNVDYQNASTTNLYLDTNIESPINITGEPSYWNNTNSFNITWTNPSDLSGIAGVYYRQYAPPFNNTNGTYIMGDDINNISGLTVYDEGAFPCYVWLKDYAGNIYYGNRSIAGLYYDTSIGKPLDLIVNPNNWTNNNEFNITWRNPTDLSGITRVYYKFDSPPTEPHSPNYVDGTNISELINIPIPEDGNHTIYIWLRDAALNVDHSNWSKASLFYDSSISSPINLQKDPDNWTNSNEFNITWTNPADLSGILGFYYKLNEAPETNTDGTYIAGDNISKVTLVIPHEGNNSLYIWLVDKAGNIHMDNYSRIFLLYDESIESPIADLISEPSDWTATNSFNISWNNPIDESGIIGAYYKLGGPPTSNDDYDYFVESYNISRIEGVIVGEEGITQCYIWLKDRAGNSNFSRNTNILLYHDATINAPIDLIGTPSGWATTNMFNLSWTNPSDIAGIYGVYYKFNDPPQDQTDGIYIYEQDINNITRLILPKNGTNVVYVWLKDNAHNVGFDNYATITLYLDSIIPEPPSISDFSISGNKVLITWVISTSNDVVSYNLYRSTSPITNISNLEPIKTFSNTTASFTDLDLADGNYYYVLTAVDHANQESIISNSIIVEINFTSTFNLILIIIIASVIATSVASAYFIYRKRTSKPTEKDTIKGKKSEGIADPEIIEKHKQEYSEKSFTMQEIQVERVKLEQLLKDTDMPEQQKNEIIDTLMTFPLDDRNEIINTMGFNKNRQNLINNLDIALKNAEKFEKENQLEQLIEEYHKILSITEQLGDHNLFKNILKKLEEIKIKSQ